MALTADGRHAVSGSWDNTLRVWDLETGQTIRTLEGHTGRVTSLALTADGRHAVSGSWDNTLRVWDLLSGECLASFTAEQKICSCAASPDGRRIVAGCEFGCVYFLSYVEP